MGSKFQWLYMFSRVSCPTGLSRMLCILTGSGKFKVASFKPEVPLSQLVDKKGKTPQRLRQCLYCSITESGRSALYIQADIFNPGLQTYIFDFIHPLRCFSFIKSNHDKIGVDTGSILKYHSVLVNNIHFVNFVHFFVSYLSILKAKCKSTWLTASFCIYNYGFVYMFHLWLLRN